MSVFARVPKITSTIGIKVANLPWHWPYKEGEAFWEHSQYSEKLDYQETIESFSNEIMWFGIVRKLSRFYSVGLSMESFGIIGCGKHDDMERRLGITKRLEKFEMRKNYYGR